MNRKPDYVFVDIRVEAHAHWVFRYLYLSEHAFARKIRGQTHTRTRSFARFESRSVEAVKTRARAFASNIRHRVHDEDVFEEGVGTKSNMVNR